MLSQAMAQRIEHWKLAQLTPYRNNPRRHSDAQIAQIAGSIAQFGFNSPVLIDSKGNIIAGHGRYLAALKLGDEVVKYAMSASIFRHFCGIALLKEYKYYDNPGNRREFHFLRDAGYIQPRLGDFIEFDERIHDAKNVKLAEATPIGRSCVKLRTAEIPPEMLQDVRNLRSHPPSEPRRYNSLRGGAYVAVVFVSDARSVAAAPELRRLAARRAGKVLFRLR